jgi:hypothetical protein
MAGLTGKEKAELEAERDELAKLVLKTTGRKL